MYLAMKLNELMINGLIHFCMQILHNSKEKVFLPGTTEGRQFLSFLMMTSEDWSLELEVGRVT